MRRGTSRSGQRGGDGLGDEGLAAAGWTVEQQPLGRTQPVGLEELRVSEGQLEGVADLLDLRPQSSDIRPGDIGSLCDDELLDVGAFDESRSDVRTQVGGQGVAGLESLFGTGNAAQRGGQGQDFRASSAGAHQDTGVVEGLLKGDGLAGLGLGEGGDDEHLVVDRHKPPDLQLGVVHTRVDVQEHLAAGEAHGDLALPSGVVSGPLAVTGVGEVLCAGNCGEQSQGDRGGE